MGDIVNTLLVDSACTAIKEDIYEKNLRPGEKVNPRVLSERYSISVTPIKLALNRLMAEGIIESIPRRGMVVKNLTRKDIEEWSDIRKMIELYCVPYAIRRVKEDPGLLEQMKVNLEAHREQLAKVQTGEYAQNVHAFYMQLHTLDAGFHDFIVATSQNRKLMEMYKNISQYFKIVYLYKVRAVHRTEETWKEHDAIFNALAKGSEKELSQALEKHIDNVREDYACSIAVQEG